MVDICSLRWRLISSQMDYEHIFIFVRALSFSASSFGLPDRPRTYSMCHVCLGGGSGMALGVDILTHGGHLGPAAGAPQHPRPHRGRAPHGPRPQSPGHHNRRPPPHPRPPTPTELGIRRSQVPIAMRGGHQGPAADAPNLPKAPPRSGHTPPQHPA